MKISKLAIVVILIVLFFSIVVATPNFTIKRNINQNNIVIRALNNLGLIDPLKIYDGYYHINKEIQAPSVLFSKGDLQLGLDLQGGTYVSLKADMSKVNDSEKLAKLADVRKVMENRVNQFGVSETNVYTSVSAGDYKIIVEIPGSSTQSQEKIDALKKTAILRIYFPKPGTSPDLTTLQTIYIEDLQNNNFNESVLKYFDDSGINGDELKNAQTVLSSSRTNSGTTPYAVSLTFSDSGAKKFNALAKASKGKMTLIALDNNMLSYPTINEDFGDNSGNNQVEITGSFTQKQADDLSASIRGGALPVPVSIAEQREIEPSLGKDALQKSLIAGGIGIIGVMLLMIILYRIDGFITATALVFYTIMSIAVMKMFSIHLTLAGVAGLILSIGIAVDANILIFERMKEEMKLGHGSQVAMKYGFERAWLSIRDSNYSTLLTCFILSTFGSVVTKGFAYNLAIGVLLSLFTSLVVVKQMLLVFRKKYRKG